MSGAPDWLPEYVSVNGEWEQVISTLYQIFREDFVRNRPFLGGIVVNHDSRILPGEQYEEGFWHLVTKTDKDSGGRLLDPRRAERLPWCAPTIKHSEDLEVRAWDYEEGNRKVRTYLWLENYDYVVILERVRRKSKACFRLITAYFVEGDSTRRNLKRKYSNRVR